MATREYPLTENEIRTLEIRNSHDSRRAHVYEIHEMGLDLKHTFYSRQGDANVYLH
jgi:hypothetical protein